MDWIPLGTHEKNMALVAGGVFSGRVIDLEKGKIERPVIYQLLVRLFGNQCERRKLNGTLQENGCGKFTDIDERALESLRRMGFNIVWLTGVLEQASGTSYPDRPADVPELLKGIAGSPYAVRDYFDVCPDYAEVPGRRLDEFRELLGRCKECGLRPIIDFVPNHVARSYASDVKPESDFGVGDDRTRFFARNHHFFYLGKNDPGGGPPLRLPGGKGGGEVYRAEADFGRVTGNNAITWAPSVNDWYETVKLNYGHDFTRGADTSHLPDVDAPICDVPKTWRTMDEILTWWQDMGVGGFRVDMAHMVPVEFWRWLVKRARERDAGVFFCAEAYDNDPAKLTRGNVLVELINAGFDAVYDAPSYRVMKGIYESGKWANDLDAFIFDDALFHRFLRYAENHDEVRMANPHEWGGLGMKVGKPVCAALFAMGRGPVMVYHGQEIGEPAVERAGFGGDNGRTSIFDYWSMPEFTKWVNGGKYDGEKLSRDQRALRAWYGKLLKLIAEPAFAEGEFYGLNFANRDNPAFGRICEEEVSGHWVYAFLRYTAEQAFLVVANFHNERAMENARVVIPQDGTEKMGGRATDVWKFADRLDSAWVGEADRKILSGPGLGLPSLPPLSAVMLEISR